MVSEVQTAFNMGMPKVERFEATEQRSFIQKKNFRPIQKKKQTARITNLNKNEAHWKTWLYQTCWKTQLHIQLLRLMKRRSQFAGTTAEQFIMNYIFFFELTSLMCAKISDVHEVRLLSKMTNKIEILKLDGGKG